MFCCLKVWRLRYCWLCYWLLLSVEMTCHSIFLTSVVTVLCLFCPLPSPKASDSSSLSLCLGESYFLFFLLEVGISHCVAIPPSPNNHHPTWGKRFPCLMFQTALPSHCDLLLIHRLLLVISFVLLSEHVLVLSRGGNKALHSFSSHFLFVLSHEVIF